MFAYHATSSPTSDPYRHMSSIALNGLKPKKSAKQSLGYRKTILGDRWRDKFLYFVKNPKDAAYMLVVHYGSGLRLEDGGAIFRFPMPDDYTQDPDTSDTNMLMTNDSIDPEDLEIFVPPRAYYTRLEGRGTANWGPDRHAMNFIKNKLLDNKYWHKFYEDGQFTDPWTNQQ